MNREIGAYAAGPTENGLTIIMASEIIIEYKARAEMELPLKTMFKRIIYLLHQFH